MKNIKLVVTAVIVMAAMSVSGQWIDMGDYLSSSDDITIGGIGHYSGIGLAVGSSSWVDGTFYTNSMVASDPNGRFDFGWGAANGANIEMYSLSHSSSPGQLRFVFGGEGTGNINYLHYNGTSWTSCLFVNYDGNVGVGTITPAAKLDVNGDIKANNLSAEGKITTKEVEITLDGWSDYVFSKDYNLKPLSEVEAFIKENKHLPNIPSEKEIVENGLSVGKMNQLLMEKVEELTLYVIQLQKEIDALK